MPLTLYNYTLQNSFHAVAAFRFECWRRKVIPSSTEYSINDDEALIMFLNERVYTWKMCKTNFFDYYFSTNAVSSSSMCLTVKHVT